MKIKGIVCFIIAFAFFGLTAASAQSVWVVDSLQRVGPSDAAGSASSISLYAAKGESESLQVIAQAPSNGMSISDVVASDLVGPSGSLISKQNIALYREYYVNVTSPSPDFGTGNRPLGAGWYPDALIPFVDPATGMPPAAATYDAVPYNVAGGQNAPFWVDINVPRNAVPGNYTGTITVKSSLGSFNISVALTVWHFTLPVNPNLKSSFGFHSALANLANNKLLLSNRVQPFVVSAQDYGTLGSYGLNIAGLPYYNESSGCWINSAPSVSSIQSAIGAFPSGTETYIYPADEVNSCTSLATSLQPWARNAHAAGTKILVTVVPTSSLMDDGTGRPDVDIWGIIPKQYCASGSIRTTETCTVNPYITQALSAGTEIWSYNEQEQDYYSPKWLIDFAPINYRIFPGFMNQRFGFTGLLYADVASWSSDPWNNVQSWSAGGYTFPGDDDLVYPGQQAGISGSSSVVPSMRLKFIRDGVDDYDYMAMLKQQGQAGLVSSVLSTVAPDWINWTKSTATLQAARIQMGQQLDKLAGGSGTSSSQAQAPPTTTLSAPSNPWPASGTAAPDTSLNTQWNSVSGATSYNFYFGTNSSSLSLYATVPANGLAYVQQPLYRLASGTTYYWQVAATNGSTSTSGPIWSFTTPGAASGGSLAAPSNPWPGSGTAAPDTSLTTQWNSVSGATSYNFYFGTNASSLPLYATIPASGGAYAQEKLYRLTSKTTFYWKVVATNGSASTSGPVWSFTTP